MARRASAEQDPVELVGALHAVLVVDEIRLDVVLPVNLTVAELRVDLVDLAERAGARPLPAAVLVDSAIGVLEPGAPLGSLGLRDGALLALKQVADTTPLRPCHQIADAADALVRDDGSQAHPGARAQVAVAASGVMGVLIAAVSVASAAAGGAVGPVIACCAAVVAAIVLHRHVAGQEHARPPGRPRRATSVTAMAVLVANCAAAGQGFDMVWASSTPQVIAGMGLGLSTGLMLATAALLRAPRPLRVWSLTSGTLLLGIGLVPNGVAYATAGPLETAFSAVLTPAQVTSGLVVALVLMAGPVASAAVDALVVRPVRLTASGARAVHPSALAERVGLARDVVVAVDVAALVLALLVTPHLMSSGASGAVLWASLVAVVLLRVRGERLGLRVLVGGAGGLAMLVVGAGSALIDMVLSDSATGPPAGALLAVLGLAGCAALLAATPTGVSVMRRPAVLLDRTLRVLLPSLWVLTTGLLPGWGG